jgi:adenylate cyclase
VPLIIDDTQRAIPETICRELDRVLVKGKANAVTIYEPLGRTPAADHAAELGGCDKALAKYREGRFAEAEIALAALAAAHPAPNSTRRIVLATQRFASSRQRRIGIARPSLP